MPCECDSMIYFKIIKANNLHHRNEMLSSWHKKPPMTLETNTPLRKSTLRINSLMSVGHITGVIHRINISEVTFTTHSFWQVSGHFSVSVYLTMPWQTQSETLMKINEDNFNCQQEHLAHPEEIKLQKTFCSELAVWGASAVYQYTENAVNLNIPDTMQELFSGMGFLLWYMQKLIKDAAWCMTQDY